MRNRAKKTAVLFWGRPFLTSLLLGLWCLFGTLAVPSIAVAQDQAMQSGYRYSATPLGRTVSRPALTYVRVGNQVVAAAIAGCGGNVPNRASNGSVGDAARSGRCVQIRKVSDGSLIRDFYTGNGLAGIDKMRYAMIGSPSVYPALGLAPASRAYLGDAVGRLWRIDLRSSNPNLWTMSIAWPIARDEDAEFYRIGREIKERPAIFLRESGKVGLVFGTGHSYRGDSSAPHILSLTDELTLGENNTLSYQAKLVWKMALRVKEVLSGGVVVRSKGVYFTTIETLGNNEGTGTLGRLYGVHATKETENYLTTDGRIQTIVPVLPTLVTSNGQRVTDAIAIRLPPGRVAYGLALVVSPSCVEDEGETTEVILNLAAGRGTEGTGGGAARIERKTGEVVPGRLDDDFLSEGRNDVAIKISAPGTADTPRTGVESAPFPRRVLYWGSTHIQ